jgi:hypothetical protein
MNQKEKLVRKLIKKNKSRFFGVSFIKADGTERSFSCRTGVSEHVTGQGLKYNPESRSNLIVWVPSIKTDDPHKKYRTIKIPRIKQLRINKEIYNWH